MSAYTPGPWHVGMKPGPMVYGPQGEQIVGVNLMLDAGEVTANARLIAEAPAMLDELYRLLPFIEDAEKDPCYKPGVVRERTKAIRAILSRIDNP